MIRLVIAEQFEFILHTFLQDTESERLTIVGAVEVTEFFTVHGHVFCLQLNLTHTLLKHNFERLTRRVGLVWLVFSEESEVRVLSEQVQDSFVFRVVKALESISHLNARRLHNRQLLTLLEHALLLHHE